MFDKEYYKPHKASRDIPFTVMFCANIGSERKPKVIKTRSDLNSFIRFCF